jgi:hypothetical protein
MVVISIIAVITGISYPSIANGLDNLKISAAADAVAGFLDTAAAKADRKQAVVELNIIRRENLMFIRSTDPTLAKKFEFPDGVRRSAYRYAAPVRDLSRRIDSRVGRLNHYAERQAPPDPHQSHDRRSDHSKA